MKTLRNLAAVCGIAVLTIALAAPANASSNRGYRGYGSCSMFSYDADRNCFVGDAYVAAFIAKKRDRVRYTLCVTNRGTGAKGLLQQEDEARRVDQSDPCLGSRYI